MSRRGSRSTFTFFGPTAPLGRSVSVLLAGAVGMVMVFGSVPAFADTAPTPAASDTTSPSPDPSTPAPVIAPAPAGSVAGDSAAAAAGSQPPPAPSSPAPAAPASPSADPSTSSPAITPATSTSTTSRAKPDNTRVFKALLSGVLPALTIPCITGSGTVVGGFEIDGDTCVDTAGNLDWDNSGQSVVDGLGDSTSFAGGLSEGDAPSTWTGGSTTPNGKSDLGTVYAFSQNTGGQVVAYFGFTNDSTSGGTSQYDLEYNQLPNIVVSPTFSRPNRSPGDLLFRFSSNGSNVITFTDAKKWLLKTDPNWGAGCQSITATAGWCTVPIPANVFTQSTSADGTFVEGAINISLLFGPGNCTGSFGVTQFRSVTGGSFYSSSLKDYVTPLSVSTPSTCGKIVINKQDLGTTSLAGATFSVSPNPDPTKSDATPFSVTDNGAGDNNPADGIIEITPVDPNQSYTVTETGAPTGYLLASPATQGPTLVGPSSTVSFTFHDPLQWKALSATKTAVPTYTAAYDWSVSKEIAPSGTGPWSTDTTAGAPLQKNVPATGNPTTSSLFYRVKVTEGARTTSLYKVSGNISVTNPNTLAVSATISDSLPGATCLVNGSASITVSVASGTTQYPYVCSFAGTPSQSQLSGTNAASVTWNKADYPQTQADVNAAGTYQLTPSATYAFGAETTSIHKTVTVTDDHHTFSPAWQITWSAQGQVDTSPTYTQDLTAAPGQCSAVLANTVSVGDTALLASDSAYGKVCAAANLTITRLDARGFTRTYPWSISKATSTPKINVVNGKATADYSVTVTAGSGTDTNWAMSGTITAHNPNAFEAITVTSATVSYTGGGTCAVNAPTSYALPAGGSHDFTYTCNFGSVQPSYSGTVNATLNWDQSAAATSTGTATDGLAVTESDWTKTLVNATVTVHDDRASGGNDVLATLDWATVYGMPNHQDVITYSTDLTVPDGGTCADRVNTAWVIGDDPTTHLDADLNAANNQASVQVCNPIGLSVSDSAAGDFTRTYNWSIDKFIGNNQKSETVHIDTYSHTFSYSVVATPGARVDSGWVISGKVGIVNDNTDPAIAPISVTGVTEIPNVGAVSDCSYDTTLPFSLASGANRDVGFSCTLASAPTNDSAEPPTYGGTHKATVTWGASGSATTTSSAVAWNAPTEVDKSIAIYDNKVTDVLSPVKLGADAVWNAAGTPTVRTYDLTLSVPESYAGSCAPEFDNLAWLGGGGLFPTARQSGAAAIICPNAAQWTLTKSSSTAPDPLMPGGTITYTLTVAHTAGVPATNVQVEDDLTNVLNNATGLQDTVASLGSTVLDPVTHLLDWTIPTLTDTATFTYTVKVNPDAWGTTFVNTATPKSTGGTCVGDNQCSTTNQTPALPKLTLQKVVINGKGGVATPKDWTLTATPVSIDGQNPVSGNGDPADAGGTSAKPVLAGQYTLSESGGPAGYSQVGGWNCGANPVDGNTVTLALDTSVTCTVTNQQDPVWVLAKSSDPASGTVQPGQQITYHLTPTWVAGVNPTNLLITDDYSGLAGRTSPVSISDPNVTMNGDNTFTWHIATLTDQTEPLSYTVTVNADAIGQTLTNLVTAPGSNCPPVQAPVGRAIGLAAAVGLDPTCSTVHVTPAWTLEKSADPVSGTTVNPGQVVTYTLTVVNTSDALVSGMQVADDLTQVLNTAKLNETPDGTTWTVDGNKLTWNVPDLNPGDTATFTYSVTMNPIPDILMINVAAPVQSTGKCLPDKCATGHPPAPLPPTPPVCTTNCTPTPTPKPPLPNTGGPDIRFLLMGLALLLAGTGLVGNEYRRKRRS